MKKHFYLLTLAVLLTACSSNTPNLVHTHKPILNVAAEVDSLIDAQVNPHSAWVKNKTENPLTIAYDLFWYDKNGVTQLLANGSPQISTLITIEPQQKMAINLLKPTEKSTNYRLYFYLK